jgi:hypothetical protein
MDPYQFGNTLYPDPHPHQIDIRDQDPHPDSHQNKNQYPHQKVISWILIRISLQNVRNMSLFEHFSKGFSLY